MGAKRKRFSMPQGKAYTIEQCHHFNISPATRELWIAGREFTDGPSETSDIIEPGVEYGMVTNVLKNLALLRQMSKTEPVTIHLHTKGGEWFQGMAIYDAIISMPYRVTIIGYAEVRSMSSIIFQAGDRRLIMPNATFMIHEGEVYYSGTPKQARSAFYFDQRTSEKKMVDIYVQKALGSSPGFLVLGTVP